MHLRQRSGGLVEEDVRLLSLVDILEPLSREEVEAIDRKHSDVRLGPGETFFAPTESCESLFLLKSGRVRIYRTTPEGREFTLAVVESGTVFGEEALMEECLRYATAEAMEESEAKVLCRADTERLLLEKPQVGLRLARLLSERLKTYETRMESLGLKEVPARLAGLLLLLVESEGLKTQTGFKLPFRYTHYQLGAMMGANREAVTRAFALLREIEAVEMRRRHIHILDIEALRKTAEGASLQRV